jgi:hypothetical protein
MAQQWREFVETTAMAPALYAEVQVAFDGAAEKSAPYGMEALENLPPRKCVPGETVPGPILDQQEEVEAEEQVEEEEEEAEEEEAVEEDPEEEEVEEEVEEVIYSDNDVDLLLHASFDACFSPSRFAVAPADNVETAIIAALVSSTLSAPSPTPAAAPSPPSALPSTEKAPAKPAVLTSATKAKKQKTQSTTMLSFFKKQTSPAK